MHRSFMIEHGAFAAATIRPADRDASTLVICPQLQGCLAADMEAGITDCVLSTGFKVQHMSSIA